MTRCAPRCVFVALLLVALAGAGVRGGQAPAAPADPQSPPIPTFRTGIEAVQVAAVVTDAAGAPVAGLTPADFEIFENGLPQAITTFAAVDIPIERLDRTGAARDVVGNDGPPGRTYLIALDDMSATEALRSRIFLRHFIETYFGPNDTAAVVLITRGLRTSGQEFTGNPRLLLEAIDRFPGGDLEGGVRENNFMASLLELTEYMARAPGNRKAIILVSRSVPGDAYDLVDYRPGFFGGLFSNVHPDFQRAVSAATRGNVAIYPIDPAGLTTDTTEAESFDTSGLEQRSTLRALAEVTGGFALTNSSGYDAAFERLVREHSTYYVLGFNSSSDRRDGRFIPLDVRVRRPDLQVRSLDGYLAPRDRPTQSRPRGDVLAAVWDAVSSPVATSGLPMRVFAAPYRSGGGRDATVAVALELDASKLDLVLDEGAYRGDLEIMLAVTDVQGRRRPVMRHRAALALKPDTYERVSRSALRVLSELSLPQGRYQVRVSAGGAVLAGSVVYDVEVPDFRSNFSLSGIAVASAQASGVLTVTPHAQLHVPFPAPPTTARQFDRSDTVVLFAEAYENRRQPHTVTFTTELRDAHGHLRQAVESRHDASERPRDTTVHRYVQTIALEDVPPGRYVIHLAAQSTLDRRDPIAREIPIDVH
jgi:VWFA-related protein